jgi:hypothetical protein
VLLVGLVLISPRDHRIRPSAVHSSAPALGPTNSLGVVPTPATIFSASCGSYSQYYLPLIPSELRTMCVAKDFITFLQGVQQYEVRFDCISDRRTFIPFRKLQTFWGISEIQEILVNCCLSTDAADAIRTNYLICFSVLVRIDQADLIEKILGLPSLKDANLQAGMFEEAFKVWPGSDTDLPGFRQALWPFCPVVFTRTMSTTEIILNDNVVLPIIEEEVLSRSLDTTVSKIRLHEEYNRLEEQVWIPTRLLLNVKIHTFLKSADQISSERRFSEDKYLRA